ncbi:unnamed protein product [Dicrocoelium dendriticum]|nr:unnamed protein product [Dicrocoelium dendriticum]
MAVPCDFDVRRFIGRGCYSVVYEISKKSGPDAGSLYALKRFFLENNSSVNCVLRERRVLERLALAEYQSPFLPMLLYSLWSNYSSAFVLREGAGCDMYDLLRHVGQLSETNARFYVAEILCGLEHLHSLSIVHLDIKPENILFYRDGHVFVSDLDRSYDMSLGGRPTLDDFTGTPLFMAPEIAKGETIDVRSDTWSLGALVAEMVSGPIRSGAQTVEQEFRQARSGTYNIRGLKRFSKPLQSFFSACLHRDYRQRPYLKDVKRLRFLKCIDWESVRNLALLPPYNVADIHHRPSKEDGELLKATDQRILAGAFDPVKPVTFSSSKKQSTKGPTVLSNVKVGDGVCGNSALPASLQECGFTETSLNEKFKSFNFVHPSLRFAREPEVPADRATTAADLHAPVVDDIDSFLR